MKLWQFRLLGLLAAGMLLGTLASTTALAQVSGSASISGSVTVVGAPNPIGSQGVFFFDASGANDFNAGFTPPAIAMSYTGLTDGNIKNLTGAPVTGPTSVPKFVTFPVSAAGSRIYFDIQSINAGTGTLAGCVDIIGSVCSIPGSPFTLTQNGSGGNGNPCTGNCSVSITFGVNGVAYFSTSPGVQSPTFGSFTTQVNPGTITSVLTQVEAPGGFTTTYSATFLSTPPPPPPNCVIPPSGTAIGGSAVSWNKFNPQGANDVVWINAHIGRPSGVSTSTVTTVAFTGVTFVLNGITYNLPNGTVIFDPGAPATPSTTFDSTNGPNGTWTTTVNPNNLSDEIFFDGNAIPVDSNISGGGQATLNFTTTSNDSNLAFNWQWSAAVFKFWPDWPTPGPSPSAGNNAAEILAYHQSDHAGTPENKTVQQSLIQGPRGGGGSNFTGSWSGTGQGKCPGAQ